MYTFESRVRFSEVDAKKQMALEVTEQDKTIVSLCDEQRTPYAVVELKEKVR